MNKSKKKKNNRVIYLYLPIKEVLQFLTVVLSGLTAGMSIQLLASCLKLWLCRHFRTSSDDGSVPRMSSSRSKDCEPKFK